MQIVNIHEAKTHLSRLLEIGGRGGGGGFARAGQPVATLTPHRPPRTPATARSQFPYLLSPMCRSRWFTGISATVAPSSFMRVGR